MIIEEKDGEMSDFAAKIISGVRKAVHQLVESSAAKNESLIIGDKDGSFKSVPAKDLLKTLPK